MRGSRLLRARKYRSVGVLAAAVLTGIAIALVAQLVGIHAMRVASGSMSPSMDRGDWIVVANLDGTDSRTIRRGDILVFSFPLGTTGRAVKRVVAIGGDTVTVAADAISVNGQTIPIAGAPSSTAARQRVERIPEGHVFFLGDNTPVSIDSRSLGPVPDADLVGRVLFIAPSPVMLSLLLLAITTSVVGSGVAVARRRRTRPTTPHERERTRR
jgi:signal peptidase I